MTWHPSPKCLGTPSEKQAHLIEWTEECALKPFRETRKAQNYREFWTCPEGRNFGALVKNSWDASYCSPEVNEANLGKGGKGGQSQWRQKKGKDEKLLPVMKISGRVLSGTDDSLEHCSVITLKAWDSVNETGQPCFLDWTLRYQMPK